MKDMHKVPHVVIIGAGFGGLRAAQDLARAPVRVTVIDRQNHHLFQPLLYQVATAAMMAESIAVPIRSVLSKQKNATVLLDEVQGVDLPRRQVALASDVQLDYDYLIIAAGARTHYFGNDDWAQHTEGLKSVEDAYAIRKRVLLAFEAAEKQEDAERRRAQLTFVVIGGGPTGVELAGALSELSRTVLARDFRRIHHDEVRVLLLEAAPSLLLSFHPSLQANAIKELGKLGVEVRTHTKVVGITEKGVQLEQDFIHSELTVWAAGVSPQPLTAHVTGATPNKRGYLPVEGDCSLPGHPEAFAIGDIASFVPQAKNTGDAHEVQPRPLPGVAPVAIQQASHVAKVISSDLSARPRKTFHYFDKGNMATIGKSRAVLEVGKLRMRGFFAWLAWLAVHVFLLIGFRNRVVVMFEWAVNYLTSHRGARLIPKSGKRAVSDRAVAEQLDAAKDPSTKERAREGWTQNVG